MKMYVSFNHSLFKRDVALSATMQRGIEFKAHLRMMLKRRSMNLSFLNRLHRSLVLDFLSLDP